MAPPVVNRKWSIVYWRCPIYHLPLTTYHLRFTFPNDQTIHRDNAFAFESNHQRIYLGFNDAIYERDLRKRADRSRKGIEIAFGHSSVAANHRETFDFIDHRSRGIHADRRKARGEIMI